MYGQIHVVVKELVESQFGEETWKTIIKQSSMDEDKDFMVFSVYDDIMTSRLMETVCRVIGLSMESLLKEFGTYFLTYCMKHGYDKMLLTLGKDLFTFVQNLDSLYSMLSLSYKGIVSPSFRCQEHDDGSLTLDYYSWRPGYFPIVQALVEAVGKHLYKQEAIVSVVDCTQQEVEPGKVQYHTVMKVRVVGGQGLFQADRTATLTKSVHGRMVINVDSAVQGGHPSHIPLGDLSVAFPYYVLMDKELNVQHCGLAILKLMTTLPGTNLHFSALATIVQPVIQPTLANIISFINSVFIIEVHTAADQQPFVLQGQMMWLPNCCQVLFMGSPRLQSLNDMKEKKIFAADIPQYDCKRELVLLNQQRMTEIQVAKKVDETTTALKHTSKELEEEKLKTERLLHELMPLKVANQLTAKGYVNAERYEWATVLFSSILTFTDIVWTCSADEVVDMLCDIFSRFDTATDVHKVYKMETISDAYMAVTGVPEEQKDHAQRMADFAMDMIVAASYVRSPATGLPLQIKVGLHSGAVVAGVIGKKKPRYDIYGDTVNVSSRMCSNSVPGRIHVTSVAFEKLLKHGYVFKTRGEIDVKGKGKMTTYFLVGTLERDLEQPDDMYTFLPDLMDADMNIDPMMKKLVKKRMTLAGVSMSVEKPRKSLAWNRPMLNVQQSQQEVSLASKSSIQSTIKPRQVSIAGAARSVTFRDQSCTKIKTHPKTSGRTKRKVTAYPRHHQETWDLSPPLSTAADIREGGTVVKESLSVISATRGSDISNSATRDPNTSNSACEFQIACPPSISSSKGHNSSFEQDGTSPQPSEAHRSSSLKCHVINISNACSVYQGDSTITQKSPEMIEAYCEKYGPRTVPDTSFGSSPSSQQHHFNLLSAPLSTADHSKTAGAGLPMWSHVKHAVLGNRKLSKRNRYAAPVTGGQGPTTSHETTSLQATSSQLSELNSLRRHSITALRSRQHRDRGTAHSNRQAGKKSCLIS